MDVQYLNGKVKDLEEDLDSRNQTIDSLSQGLSKLESTVNGLRATLSHQRDEFDKELSSKIEEARNKWLESVAQTPGSPDHQPMQRSPTINTDGLGFHPPYSNLSRREMFLSPSGDPGSDGQPQTFRQRPSFSSPIGQESSLSLPSFVHPLHNNSSRSSLPLVNPSNASIIDEEEDYFVGNNRIVGGNSNAGLSSTPISPQARHFSQDLVSTSTVAAGPSVQLVERMSATVRRLETEKAASKEELARMASQRDEARQEIVELMREVEQKREFEERCKVLEEEIREMNKKQEAALELLGEKTEEVEELKADVMDLKQMLKDLMSDMK